MGVSSKERSPSRSSSVLAIALLLIPTLLPGALGDGVPAVPSFRFEEDDQVFESIFESRQLAQVELVNDTHERINLFLSVYSLEPGDNLSVVVPLRTLPEDISGRPMDEAEFRQEFRIAKAEQMVVEQDPGEAWGRVGHYTGRYCKGAMGSLLWSLPGEYVRQNVVASEGNWGEGLLMGGMLSASEGEQDIEVQHYEFDGFTIQVLAVTAGPTMSAYLASNGYSIPDSSVFDAYADHYVAIVESETRPPIDPVLYQVILEEYPELVPRLLDELERDPTRSDAELDSLRESVIYATPVNKNRNLREPVLQLVDAVFGKADFSGELLTIDLPLDGGRIYFPLGTSGGWPNEIGDIDVLFKVPEGKDLDVKGARDAFFEGHHWYLFQMSNAAPDFDLQSDVARGDPDRSSEAARSEFVYDNARGIALGITAGLVLLLWLSVTLLLAWRWGRDRSVLRDRRLWLLLGGAFLLSIPGVLLVSLLLEPLPLNKLRGSFVVRDLAVLYIVAAALLVVGVGFA